MRRKAARSGGRRATSPARCEAVAEQSTGRDVCNSGGELGRGVPEEGHDVHAVSWKDREMRVVLEEAGGGLDGLGLNDDVAAEGFTAPAMPSLVTRVVLPTMPPRSGNDAAFLSSQSAHCFNPTVSIASCSGGAAKAGEVFGIHGVDGEKAGHAARSSCWQKGSLS